MGSGLVYESYAEDDMTDSEDEFHDCESDGQSLPPPKNEVNIFFAFKSEFIFIRNHFRSNFTSYRLFTEHFRADVESFIYICIRIQRLTNCAIEVLDSVTREIFWYVSL